MIAAGITGDALRAAAQAVGVTVDMRALNAKRTRWQVKVNPGPLPLEALTPKGNRRKGPAGNNRYQRVSGSAYRSGRVNAVCWHGFRDFFRAAFRLAPDAVFRTALDTWRGSADFEARFRESGFRNVGAPIAPRYACDVCVCPEAGEA